MGSPRHMQISHIFTCANFVKESGTSFLHFSYVKKPIEMNGLLYTRSHLVAPVGVNQAEWLPNALSDGCVM